MLQTVRRANHTEQRERQRTGENGVEKEKCVRRGQRHQSPYIEQRIAGSRGTYCRRMVPMPTYPLKRQSFGKEILTPRSPWEPAGIELDELQAEPGTD